MSKQIRLKNPGNLLIHFKSVTPKKIRDPTIRGLAHNQWHRLQSAAILHEPYRIPSRR
jgi:hypothetical protein